eukprot:3525024-Rhodomonas_salina.1
MLGVTSRIHSRSSRMMAGCWYNTSTWYSSSVPEDCWLVPQGTSQYGVSVPGRYNARTICQYQKTVCTRRQLAVHA